MTHVRSPVCLIPSSLLLNQLLQLAVTLMLGSRGKERGRLLLTGLLLHLLTNNSLLVCFLTGRKSFQAQRLSLYGFCRVFKSRHSHANNIHRLFGAEFSSYKTAEPWSKKNQPNAKENLKTWDYLGWKSLELDSLSYYYSLWVKNESKL